MAKSRTGKLNSRVTFYKYIPKPGIEPGEKKEETAFECWAEIYEGTVTDKQLTQTVGSEILLNIVIRDPGKYFQPTNKNFVEIKDYRFKGIRWNVKSVRPDFSNRSFITVLLGAVIDG